MKAKHVFILLLTGCLLCTGCGEKQEVSPNSAAQETTKEADQRKIDVSLITDEKRKHSVSESMMVNDCSTYQVMEDQSDCIVYGKKVREYFREPQFEGDTYDLMAEFEIQDQIKAGEKEYQAGDKIVVAEEISYDADYDIIYHIGGYQKMQTEKMYYLMLGKGDEADQYYLIGGLYGKVPEDIEEDVIYKTNELGEVKQEEIDWAEKWINRNRKELERKNESTLINEYSYDYKGELEISINSVLTAVEDSERFLKENPEKSSKKEERRLSSLRTLCERYEKELENSEDYKKLLEDYRIELDEINNKYR